MKAFKVALPILGLAVAAVATAQDSFVLRYKFEPNKMYFYKVVTNIDGTMSGMMGSDEEQPMKMGLSMEMRTEVAGVKEGVATLIGTFKNMKMTASMGGMEMPDMGDQFKDSEKSVLVTQKMNERGEMLDTKMEGLPPQLSQSSMTGPNGFSSFGWLPVFPEAAVRIGDTWVSKLPFPMNALIGDSQKTMKLPPIECKATFVGLDKVGEVKVFKLDCVFDIPVDMDMSKMLEGNAPEGMSMAMKGKQTIKSTLYLDMATCLPVSMKMSFDSDVKMHMTGGPGPAADMTMHMKMKGSNAMDRTKVEDKPTTDDKG